MQTIPFNVTGNPAMSIPIGFSSSNLPLSMQIVGAPFADAMVLRIGRAFEKANASAGLRPSLALAAAA
jgi:aspartyl-tRNA(Asn)/glutamyl-tRNA(Gln) amidotransferase subunit A